MASGTNVDLTYILEDTRGVTPSISSGDTTYLRLQTRNINPAKNLLQSQEVRTSRQRKDSRHGFTSVGGTFGFEYSLASFDDLLLMALGASAWASPPSATPELGAVASSQTLTRASGSFVSDGFKVGQVITTTGFTTAGNNGRWTIIGVAAGALTVAGTDGAALTDEAADTGQTIVEMVGKTLSVGTTLKTMTLQRAFRDLTLFEKYRGVSVNTLQLQVQPEQLVTGTVGLLGMVPEAMNGTALDASPTAAGTSNPFSSFVGTLGLGGLTVGIVTGITLDINNNRSLSPVLFSKYSPDVYDGDFILTGTLTAHFANSTYYNAFINETELACAFRLDDPDGTNFVGFGMPRIKFTGNTKNPPQRGPVIEEIPFEALEGLTGDSALHIHRSNA